MRVAPLIRFPFVRLGAKPQAASVAVAIWCAQLFVYGLCAGPVYRTESLRAIIGAECLNGHWLYPVLYGEPFLTKPPGHYVAIALCSLPFGQVTDWSARLPSAIAATATVFLMWTLMRRAFDERIAFLASLLIPTSVLWLDKVPSAEIDMTLVGWVTAAIVLFHKALQGHGPSSVGLLTFSLICVAAGTLTKWTAPAFFYLMAVPLLAWRRQLRFLVSWQHLVAVGIAGLFIAAWAAAVANEVGWEKLRDTIRSEALYRFNPPAKAKGYPWTEVFTYPLLVLAAHLPLSIFSLRTLRPSFLSQLDDRAKLLVQLLHCWVWPNLLFWSLVPNHNVRYVLPISPALMALGAIGALWGSRQREPDARAKVESTPCSRGGLPKWLLAFLLTWMIAKIAFTEVVVPQRTAGRDAEATALQLRELVPPQETLYLFKLKDEGILFYYGRAGRKLFEPRELPRGAFALLIQSEWDARTDYGDVQLIRCMYDQQGAPIYLIRLN